MIVTVFARRVKRLRTELGLTVRDLAAALGKSAAYVAKIEVQGEIPTPELTCEIARVLGTDPSQLLELAKKARLSSFIRDIDQEYARASVNRATVEEYDLSEERNARGVQKMATVVSLINMKGGVGKTTLAMQLAHTADELSPNLGDGRDQAAAV